MAAGERKGRPTGALFVGSPARRRRFRAFGFLALHVADVDAHATADRAEVITAKALAGVAPTLAVAIAGEGRKGEESSPTHRSTRITVTAGGERLVLAARRASGGPRATWLLLAEVLLAEVLLDRAGRTVPPLAPMAKIAANTRPTRRVLDDLCAGLATGR